MFLLYQIMNTGDAPHGSSCVPETALGNEANVTGIKKEKKSDITNKAWVPLLNADRSNSKCGNIQSICCLASFVLVPVSYPAGGALLTQTVQNRAHRAANQTSFWVRFACQCSYRGGASMGGFVQQAGNKFKEMWCVEPQHKPYARFNPHPVCFYRHTAHYGAQWDKSVKGELSFSTTTDTAAWC